jgi:hypothetical protein
MSTPRILGDEVYQYPDTGDINYGEEASGWVEGATDILNEFSGPGDIPTTEVNLIGATVVDRKEGNITNLIFDTAYVQSITVTGFITRTYTDATPTQVESFTIDGVYNGTDILFSPEYTGDDTEFEFYTTGGQFGFSYLIIANTDTVTIKYSAKAKIDESYFE